ncbi:alpha/beta fold hydrolase [Oligoflexus tunisiensis]|uniref:alpha/beta fold hydrolase n=1 Tax=Oligoflexus tunisiensis TaxID=708132 RepID=UPI00114CE747|nr:alpha/beta fold hydrolase [Oligoflexus tunisiensis]
MIYQYGDLTVQAFRDEPATVTVNGWTINYMGFCRSEHRNQTPLVLLGGAFQSFASFMNDVKAYLPQMPVLLVALPGQASNKETRDASMLSLRDMADLLEGFFQELRLEQVALAGYSYGSLLAYTYAFSYEMRLEQLILVGCSLDLRHTQKQILQYAVDNFNPETINTDSEAASQAFFNLNAMDATGLSLGLVESLIHSIRRLSPEDLASYRSNSARVLRERLPQRNFQVRTLVLAAAYDHYTTPDQSLEVHGCFENGDFVLLEKADHLLPLRRPQLINQTILQFLFDAPYEGEGVLYGDAAIARASERRQQARYKVKGLAVVLTHADQFRFEGILDDVSLNGCGITLPGLMSAAAEFDGTWQLEIGASEYKIPGFLRVNHGKANFVFFKKTLSDRKHINDFIESFQDLPLTDRLNA